ncbi:uncharacterized protein M421DRAFT_104981 [Didymella exigua CBS 183.55]|uniref:RING-type domain-containing protein n=1 Tax=Didymella exigua CBS 183.55 TaxID=1150837 RepID=A0A6A5R570_9PLEO|nr:uncharacterized protein M421DRAFT_104981 [Didymella exigua CBS 183.55]KAF1922559.1 hypothetical protein M421DRAFT_104981 [Didymella exigua CBS 183.55]
MSQSTESKLPYKSMEAFFSHGVNGMLLNAALDCSICREPLAITLEQGGCAAQSLPSSAVLSMVHTSVNFEESNDLESSSNEPTTAAFTDNSVGPEQAVRISPCNHTFGRTCIEVWFTTSKSNRCPECNQELFPQRHIELFLRFPTRAMRLEFADYIEQFCGDSETAGQIRVALMSDWTRSLIRELAMELWRQQGYDVEYRYVGDAEAGEEEEEIEVEDMNEDEEEETNEMETDESDSDDSKEAECGVVEQA